VFVRPGSAHSDHDTALAPIQRAEGRATARRGPSIRHPGEGRDCFISLPRIGSFRSAARPESLSLCVAKEKVTQEKGHPAWRLPPIPGRQVREPRPGFSTAHPCAGEKASPSLPMPATRPVDLDSPPHRGPG
jgi:hypothetical protein